MVASGVFGGVVVAIAKNEAGKHFLVVEVGLSASIVALE